MTDDKLHRTNGAERPTEIRSGAGWSHVALTVSLGSLLVAPLFADDVVRIERLSETWSSGGELVLEGTEEGILYLGDDMARFDQGTKTSWILQRDRGRLLLLDHDQATFQDLRLPVRLEEYFDGEDLESFRALERRVAPRIETAIEPEPKEIDGWTAHRVTLEGTPAESETRYEYELWVTRDLPIDEKLHGALLRSFGALHLAHRDIAREIAALDGFPVVRRSLVTRAGGARDVDVRRVIEVTDRDVDPALYRPPEEYRRVPFDPSAWVRVTAAEAAP